MFVLKVCILKPQLSGLPGFYGEDENASANLAY